MEAGGSGGRRLADELVARGAITERQRAEALGEAWGVPFADLSADNLDVAPVAELLSLLPPGFCRAKRVLPFGRADGRVLVAMADPLDVFTVSEVYHLLGRDARVAIHIASPDDIRAALERAARGLALSEDLQAILDELAE